MKPLEIEAFLQRPLVAVFSTTCLDGTVHSVPVWFEYEGGKFYCWTGSNSMKARNLQRVSKASICIATPGEPYQYVSANGAVEMVTDDITERCLSICRRYYSDERARAFVRDDLSAGDSLILVLAPQKLISERSA